MGLKFTTKKQDKNKTIKALDSLLKAALCKIPLARIPRSNCPGVPPLCTMLVEKAFLNRGVTSKRIRILVESNVCYGREVGLPREMEHTKSNTA